MRLPKLPLLTQLTPNSPLLNLHHPPHLGIQSIVADTTQLSLEGAKPLSVQETLNVCKVKRVAKVYFDLCTLPELACEQELIAGVDEVGRGALFGPVVAAAVILPKSSLAELAAAGAGDSKQLSANRRHQLTAHIQKAALDWKIGFASTREIDQINILQASLLAMKRAVTKLKVQPEICLVDGKQAIPALSIPQLNLVKGDERSLVIAAASIVAKVWRDDLLIRLAAKYPAYDLAANKGYGTARHLLALQQYGPSVMHRISFRPCRVKLN